MYSKYKTCHWYAFFFFRREVFLNVNRQFVDWNHTIERSFSPSLCFIYQQKEVWLCLLMRYTPLTQHFAQQMTEAFLDCKRNHLLGSQTGPTKSWTRTGRQSDGPQWTNQVKDQAGPTKWWTTMDQHMTVQKRAKILLHKYTQTKPTGPWNGYIILVASSRCLHLINDFDVGIIVNNKHNFTISRARSKIVTHEGDQYWFWKQTRIHSWWLSKRFLKYQKQYSQQWNKEDKKRAY